MEFLVVGLGNMGMNGTRHNIGMMCLDHWWNSGLLGQTGWSVLDRKMSGQFIQSTLSPTDLDSFRPKKSGPSSWETVRVTFYKPNKTFMNVCGGPVKATARHLSIPPERIFLVHDDLDAKWGRCALKRSGSASGHNGVRSIIDALSSKACARARLGIGRPSPDLGIPIDQWVLSRFSAQEQEQLPQMYDQGFMCLVSWLDEMHRPVE